MPSEERLTPYSETMALFQSGASESAIAQRMHARGLDDESVKILLNAVKARSPDPENQTVESVEHLQEPDADGVTPAAIEPLAPHRALGPCTRCGTFVTVATHQLVVKKLYCLRCAARPDVNYLKAFRDEHWGKRDGWAWLFGVFAVLAVLGIANAAVSDGPVAVPAAAAVAYALFWAGVKPARVLLVTVSLVIIAVTFALGRTQGAVILIFVMPALRSRRNKLFFKIELTEDELMQGWKAAHDNRVALWGRGLTIIALLSCAAWLGNVTAAFATFGFGLLGTILGVIGLRRVNPVVVPPVGQRGAALFAVIGGIISSLGALAFLAESGALTAASYLA